MAEGGPANRLLDGVAALGAVGVVTLGARLAGLNPTTVGLVLLLCVLAVAVVRGLLAATVASFAATLAFNFFFLPPLHTFTIAEPSNWVALGSFLIVAVVVSRLVVRAREEAASAEARRREQELLYGLSVDLFAATNRVGVLGEAALRAVRSVGATGGGLLVFDEAQAGARALAWTGPPLSPEGERLVGTVAERRESAEVPASGGRRDAYFPLDVGGRSAGALVLLGAVSPREVLEPVARLVALAVERERFLAENAHLEAVRQSEALKTSLLRAVSHDLRTPLTAITLQVDALRRRAGADGPSRRELDDVARETARLSRRIDNLLALARLESGRSVPNPEPTPAADLFRSAREALPIVLDEHPVHVGVDRACPDLLVDPSLALEVLVNLVENAAQAAPAGTPIELSAARHPVEASLVRIEISDRGRGFSRTAHATEPDVPSDVSRRGLGLEIARGLSAVNGGEVSLLPRPGGGTVARVDFPAAPEPEDA